MANDEAKPKEQAYARALGYLQSAGSAVWLAHLSAIAGCLVVIGLLGVLWLFIDYLAHRGRVPRFSELSFTQQQAVQALWLKAPPEKRQQWLEGTARPISSDSTLMEPGRGLTFSEAELVWPEMVYEMLNRRYGKDAVDIVFIPDDSDPSGMRMSAGDHGLLSLAVRSELRSGPSLIPYITGWNRWAWGHGPAEVTIFPPYLAGMALMALFLGLAGAFFTILNREMAARAATDASSRLRRAVYHHTFRLGQLAIRALGPTEAVTILTRHIEALHDSFYSRLTVYFREPVMIGLLVAFALMTEPLLAVAFLLFVLVVYAVGVKLVNTFRRQSKLAAAVAGERLTIIRESLMMMRLVKTYLMDQFNQSRMERQLSRYGAVQRLRHRADAMAMPLLILLGGACALVLLYVGALMVLYGGLSLSGGGVMVATLLLLYPPLDHWLESRTVAKRGRESAEQVFAFLDRRSEVGQVPGAEFLAPMTQSLELVNVSLRDPGSKRNLLEDVSLTIPAGQRVGLVGPDELEKQALVYLIPRLLDPTAGEIRIDSRNLRWVTLDSLRAQVGLVMMHNLVFHDTVRNNIGCGDAAYTLPQIIEAAKMAHAHKFIQALPQGYETPIGELGHPLTMFEQYRIALARAILRDPALLIIEEPDADLDDEAKSLLDDTLARLLPERTAIFLPHRVSTLRSCSRIFLINKGKLVASGTHRELLAGNKLYRHLHYLEFNEVDER